MKTLPLHHSQQILSEDETGITVKLRLRITNDFVMELLSRSRSVEVVAPHTLRTRLYDTLRQAAERNKPIETECDSGLKIINDTNKIPNKIQYPKTCYYKKHSLSLSCVVYPHGIVVR